MKKFKVALCYYGNIGSYKGKQKNFNLIHPETCFRSIKYNLFNTNPECHFDIFTHSWSLKYKAEILDTLQPLKHNIEEQKSFLPHALKRQEIGIRDKRLSWAIKNNIKSILNKSFRLYKIDDDRKSLFASYSRWYSTFKTVELKSIYESENNFKYDFVMLIRYDMKMLTPFIIRTLDQNYFYAASPYKTSNIFGQEIENDRFHFQDYWFLANSQNMDIFSTVFYFLDDYYAICPHRSSYQHAKRFIGETLIRYYKQIPTDFELLRLLET